MPEAAQSPLLGRCPTCGRWVTMPVEARAKKVACPACRYQGAGASFAEIEAPLPVLIIADGGSARDDDEPRTHLVLNPADVQDEEETAEAPGSASDDARTRLKLGPLSAGARESRPPGRGAAWRSRAVPVLLRASVALDEALHGRSRWALAGLALSCGLIAPLLDYFASDGRSTLRGFTLVFVLLAFTGLGVAHLHTLKRDDGQWDPKVARLRIQSAARTFFDSCEQFADSPPHLRQLLIGQALTVVGLTAFAWAGMLSAIRLLFGLLSASTSLPFVGGTLVLAGVAVSYQASRSAPALRFSLQESGNALAAAAELPPIVDLNEPLPEPFGGGTTLLHKSLLALVSWPAQQSPDEAAYRAALERHLQRRLPACRVERERWVGRAQSDGIIDLVIDGVVVIGIQRGFQNASAQRAIARMKRYARTWAGKPMILAVFDAPREAVFDSTRAASLNALHKEFALLTVRMPSQL